MYVWVNEVLLLVTGIGDTERTQKVQMSSIHSVISEPIVGHEEYHIMVSKPDSARRTNRTYKMCSCRHFN